MTNKPLTHSTEAPAVEVLRDAIIETLSDHKAESIRVVDNSVVHYSDFAILATGNNVRHQRTLGNKILQLAKNMGVLPPVSIEGMETGSWVSIDLFSVVIHLQSPQARTFYGLDSLWDDLITLEEANSPQ